MAFIKMRFWLRIPALMVCGAWLCIAQAPAHTAPANPLPDAESAAQNPPETKPEAPVPTPQGAAPEQAKTPQPAPAAQAPAADKNPGLEPAPTKRPSAAGAQNPPMPKSAVTDTPDGKPYVIGPLDVLYVRVWNNPNLTGMVDVRSDGMISLALIGELKADGLTVQQLIEQLKTRLGEYLLNPEVDVQVPKVNSKKFLVVGEVSRPGEFPLVGKMTIFEALATAGLRETANQKKIYLLRGKDKHPFNYKEVIEGKNLKQDIPIENGDRIVVPQ